MSPEDSPDSDCRICLQGFNNLSSLDLCWHKFCFCCIYEWSKIKAECPLCNQPFNLIYHSVKSVREFKTYNVKTGHSYSSVIVISHNEAHSYSTRAQQSRTEQLSLPDSDSDNRVEEEMQEFPAPSTSEDGCSNSTVIVISDDEDYSYSTRAEQSRTERLSRRDFDSDSTLEDGMQQFPAPSASEVGCCNSSVIVISDDEDHLIALDPPGDSTTSTLRHAVWDDKTPGPSYSTRAEQNRTEQLSLPDSDTDSSLEEEMQEFGASPQHLHPQNQKELTQDGCNNECSYSDSDDCIIVGFVKPPAESPKLIQLSSDSSDDSGCEDKSLNCNSKSHYDKLGGKRKRKTRHFEEAHRRTPFSSHSNVDSSTSLIKHKKKFKDQHHKKSKEELRGSRRKPSVEPASVDHWFERSRCHYKKKKKHEKKSKRHKSNEHRIKHSPTVITIESDSDYCTTDMVIQARGSITDNSKNTTDDPAEPLPPLSDKIPLWGTGTV